MTKHSTFIIRPNVFFLLNSICHLRACCSAFWDSCIDEEYEHQRLEELVHDLKQDETTTKNQELA